MDRKVLASRLVDIAVDLEALSNGKRLADQKDEESKSDKNIDQSDAKA